MENFNLEYDLKVFYVTATSFPAGVQQAFEDLRELLPSAKNRILYGISRPEQGKIVYRAAVAENYQGEGEQYHCPTLILPKGNYIAQPIHNWPQNISEVTPTFQNLLQRPGLDPEGYCVEWYKDNSELVCMVRLSEEHVNA